MDKPTIEILTTDPYRIRIVTEFAELEGRGDSLSEALYALAEDAEWENL
jgi:hypothetical protein